MSKITTKQILEKIIVEQSIDVDEVIVVGLEGDIKYNVPNRSTFKINWEVGYRDSKGVFTAVESDELTVDGDDAIAFMNTIPKAGETVWEATENAAVAYLQAKNLV